MSNVINFNSARASLNSDVTDVANTSPMEALLIRFEPLVESVKANPDNNHSAELLEFKALLENSREELAELEQMTNFLLALNSAQHPR